MGLDSLIQFVVFSRRRPLQLEGYLRSLYANCTGEFKVSVLVKRDPEYVQAYGAVFSQFPKVLFVQECDFAADLSILVDTGTALTCFGCDDVIYTTHIETDAIGKVLDDESLLGVSLRLGENITHDMFGRPLQQPEIKDQQWDMTAAGSVGDWAYPFEVLGTVYRTEYVRQIVEAVKPKSPSQLESLGYVSWNHFTRLHHMACYPTSRLVVPTVNVIQQEFPNGTIGPPISPEFLLDCWNHGLRLDTERYAGMAPPSWRIGDFWLKRTV